ncbi:MAG TPA: hypothetical protein V6D18_00575 [Thermosynechococcaceae cyanobacterium]
MRSTSANRRWNWITGLSADGVLVVFHDPLIDPALCSDTQGQRLPSASRQLLKLGGRLISSAVARSGQSSSHSVVGE